jgi:2-desacetyl-2-hydroxyethyl bacteriochlorophyllide A dehydrogenase
MRTQAVIHPRKSATQFAEIELPPPGSDEVQVRTTMSAISVGTEGWVMADVFSWIPTKFPCVPGYQRVGIVTGLGDGVRDIKLGSRVVATQSNWPDPWTGQWGSHAAVGNTPASEIYAVPEGVADEDAAACVIAQVGWNAASRIVMDKGDWVLVYGDGLIGQFAAQAARERGARVAMVGHRAERLGIAEKYSADVVVNNNSEDVASVMARHAPAGICAVIDTTQNLDAQLEFSPLLQHGSGQVVYSGFTTGTHWGDMARLQQDEFTVHFVSGWTRERMLATLACFAAGTMSFSNLITHRRKAEKAPELYDMTIDKSEPFLGLLIDWRS